jgi:hypothetical protein
MSPLESGLGHAVLTVRIQLPQLGRPISACGTRSGSGDRPAVNDRSVSRDACLPVAREVFEPIEIGLRRAGLPEE